jgi:coenzyme F420-reducing hydrogenase beta subunit
MTIYGKIHSIMLAHAKEKHIRHMASSGGFVKSFLCYLVDNGYKAIITRMNGLKPETIITEDKGDILDVRTNSCYQEHNYLNAVNNLPEDKYVAVGLGCHVKYMREKYPEMFIIGLLCNHTPKYAYTEELIKRSGVKSPKQITYRGYGWPGFIDVDGIKMEFTKNWSEAYKPKKCIKCSHTCDEADIVCGDPWHLDEPNRTLVICRNLKSTLAIFKVGSIYVDLVGLKTLEKSQAHHFKNKKVC